MVFVTVAMACWVNAQSAILRLFLAIRMFRVLTERPNPFSNCCCIPTKIEDCTEGLNKLAAEVEEERVLSHPVKKLVPVWKPCTYCVLNVELCRANLVSGSGPAKASGARLEDVHVREPWVVTLHHDVHAVFQRQLHRFLHAQLQLSVMDELVDSGRIGEAWRFDTDRTVGSEETREKLGSTGIVVLRRAESDRHDWRGRFGGRCLRSLRRFLPEGRGNGPSHERYGQYGGQQRSSIQRLHSAPYPQDSSPKGLNLYVLNSVKRSQNGICFKKLTVLRSQLKSDSFAGTPGHGPF